MKYLKYFEQASAYEAYKNGSDYVLPNVSYAADNNVIYYNPYAEAKSGIIMARYNATEDNMLVLADTSNVKSLKVNGTEVEFSDMYYFSEVGEYDVEIELIDPTFIESETFYGTCLTSINIPDSVTSIGSDAFTECTSLPVEDNLRYADTYLVGPVDKSLSTYTIKEGTKWIGSYAFSRHSDLTSITIPNSVTSIGFAAFQECLNLTEVTCNAITAPTIMYPHTFAEIANNGVLKVPTGSDYSSWMNYLNKYN